MKILLVTAEEWNDYVYGNGVLTNWFTGFDAEFAQIYTSPGLPNNKVCHRYFQIDERQMVRSLFSNKKAGHEVTMPTDAQELEATKSNAQRKGIYGLLKKVSLRMHTPVVMLRDLIWTVGRYDKRAMKKFIDDFQPDVVFCEPIGSPMLWRLERIVSGMTEAPLVAFTGDDEASYQHISYSPLYWIRQWYLHNGLRRSMRYISHYFMHSEEQAADYSRMYGIPTSTLFKCGDFKENMPSIGNFTPPHAPIRLVYAGHIYCNRWKTLAEIGGALKELNRDGLRMVLDVYTQDALTSKQSQCLCEENYIYMKGCVTPAELQEVYHRADIALHVESMDKRSRLTTRLSFSTKIIDLMASSCAILAICWEQHCGYKYLRKNDAALCVDDYNKILPILQSIVDNPALIAEYAQKAYGCGRKNHTREKIQRQLKEKFEELMMRPNNAEGSLTRWGGVNRSVQCCRYE